MHTYGNLDLETLQELLCVGGWWEQERQIWHDEGYKTKLAHRKKSLFQHLLVPEGIHLGVRQQDYSSMQLMIFIKQSGLLHCLRNKNSLCSITRQVEDFFEGKKIWYSRAYWKSVITKKIISCEKYWTVLISVITPFQSLNYPWMSLGCL